MSDEMEPRDRDLMDLFMETLDEQATPSDGFIDLVMAGYDLTTSDSVIAELIRDSDLDAEPALVRGPDLGARILTFRSPDLEIQFEIGHEAPEIVGRIDPGQSGEAVLEQPGGVSSRDLDESGRFEFALSNSRPFRLRFALSDGRSITTDWVVP